MSQLLHQCTDQRQAVCMRRNEDQQHHRQVCHGRSNHDGISRLFGEQSGQRGVREVLWVVDMMWELTYLSAPMIATSV